MAHHAGGSGNEELNGRLRSAKGGAGERWAAGTILVGILVRIHLAWVTHVRHRVDAGKEVNLQGAASCAYRGAGRQRTGKIGEGFCQRAMAADAEPAIAFKSVFFLVDAREVV